jgi:hypothetical protein
MKRLILNTVALLVIVAVGFLALRAYDPPPMTMADSGIPVPEVKYLEIADTLFEPENGRIAIALVIPERVPPTGGIIADILEVYRWSRSYYLPIKCGEDYPPEMCRIGLTEIYLIQPTTVMRRGMPIELDTLLISMGLDQIQIDKLLNGTPPETLQELFGFHEQVMQTTQSTGGYIYQPEEPQLFLAIPR